MALPVWPGSLPTRLLRDAYVRKPLTRPVRSEMEMPSVTRQRSMAAATVIEQATALRMTAAQASDFEAFWQGPLGRGASMFTMPVFDLATKNYVSRTVRIVDGAYDLRRDGIQFVLIMRLEIF